MDTLKAMRVFVEVARHQGFAPAAKKLSLSTSSVSRHILNLETELKRQLFVRTTRNLTLTQAGVELLDRCQRIVADADDLLLRSRGEDSELSGRLRITMPEFLASLFAQRALPTFVAEHRKVRVELVALSRVVNLIDEDFDLAIRVGDLPDSSLIARKLMDLRLVMVAAPQYLQHHGTPKTPADLGSHFCIVETESPYKDRWPLVHGSGKRRHPVKGNLRVNLGETARDIAVGGAGLCLLPIHMVLSELEDGALITVLDDYTPDYGGVFAVYPQTRYVPRTVRAFVEFLIAQIDLIPSAKLRRTP